MNWRSLFGAWYAEDVIRLAPKFTLSLGFRDEFTTGWNEAHGRAANYTFTNGVISTKPQIGNSIFTANNATFLPQPRIGLAWSPFSRKTVIRAGFGMYNDLQDALGYRTDQNAPFNPTYSIASLPVASLPLNPTVAVPASAKLVPGGVQPDMKTPTLVSWSLRIEQELTPNTALTIGYVASHGYHELIGIDANEPTPTICPASPCPATYPTVNSTSTPPVTITTGFPAGSPLAGAPVPAGSFYIPAGKPRANPALANTWTWLSEGVSSYNALQVDVNHRFSYGVLIRGVYTWSKSLDDGDSLNATTAGNAPGLAANPFNLRERIQAQRRSAPGTRAQAQLLVLPWSPFDLVEKVDPGWLSPYSGERPFLDPLTQKRSGPEAGRVATIHCMHVPEILCVGYGLPFTLRWTPQAGAQSQRLTLVQGSEATCRDVTGQDRQELTLTGPVRRCMVEGLRRHTCREEDWVSLIQEFPIYLRGLVPVAGNALAGPGHADGPGISARFREPFGLATVFEWEDSARRSFFLVTDPASQVIRKVSADGQVTAPWGLPDQPGHLDAAPATSSQFNQPTFLLATSRREWDRPEFRFIWMAWVSDTGNHVVRTLHQDGSTATLAGTPGLPGHRDAPDGRTAQFHSPRGLAQDFQGNLYVADSGNQVIRRITPTGAVDTVAGSPGKAGSQDGLGAAARFTQLQGLAYDASTASLMAVDGHAVRRVRLPEGAVTTVLGMVETAGCREVNDEQADERAKALRQPCLNRPCGIVVAELGAFAIADTGNHSVRLWCPASDLLLTQAGHPDQGEIRWGLPADAMGVPGDERYAALASPRTLAVTGGWPRTLLVTTGACVAELGQSSPAWDDVPLVRLRLPPASCLEPCLAQVTLWDGLAAPGPEPLHFSVDFIEDGRLVERRRGTALPGIPVAVEGTFTRPGTATVLVRCVNSRGFSAGARQEIQVQ